jgi:hypothetical protein
MVKDVDALRRLVESWNIQSAIDRAACAVSKKRNEDWRVHDMSAYCWEKAARDLLACLPAASGQTTTEQKDPANSVPDTSSDTPGDPK